MKTNMGVEVAGIWMKNPILTASGTAGFGQKLDQLFPLQRLGALIVKGITLEPRFGNPPPRVVETRAGMLNSVGLENPGVDHFIAEELPRLQELSIPIIVNISGETIGQYSLLAEKLDGQVAALELNVSCPNVEKGGMAFGTDAEAIYQVVKGVSAYTSLPLVVKLSPNVTLIEEMAVSAVSAGASALSLINTITGMAVDLETKKPLLPRGMGGLSGPCIKPIALAMVHRVAKVVDVPIIGTGGIMDYRDALEFILVGAKAVAVGTGTLIHPLTCIQLLEDMQAYLEKKKMDLIDIYKALDVKGKRGGTEEA